MKENVEITSQNDVDLKYKNCDRYKDSDKRLLNFCRSIQGHTKKHKDYYKNYVNTLLEPYRSKLPKKERDKYLPILELISKHKPELKNKVNDFLNDIENISYVVDDDGKWHPVNKLNTNYSDLSELLTHMVSKFFGNKSTDVFLTKLLNRDFTYEYIQKYDGTNSFIMSLKKQYDNNNHLTLDQLLSLSSNVDILNHEYFIKEGLEKVLNKKVVLSIDEIKDFINNTTKNSYEGEMVEDVFYNVLIENGWNMVHRGGNGDFIDMKFGIDMIVEKNNVYKFIQVKKVWDIKFIDETIMRKKEDGGAYLVSGKVTDVREDTIDLLGLGTLDGKYILTERQHDVIEYKDTDGSIKYTYGSKKILPSPRNGFCYIDKPFENIKKIIC